jgi:hypothetical protein
MLPSVPSIARLGPIMIPLSDLGRIEIHRW